MTEQPHQNDIAVDLSGRTVLTCRQEGRSAELHALIEAAGGSTIDLPLIEVVEPDDSGAALSQAIATVDRFDWVVFTSSNSVAAVARELESTKTVWPERCRIAVVGPATTAAVEQSFRRSPDLVAYSSDGGTATAADIPSEFPMDPQAVLVPLAALANDDLEVGLTALGHHVSSVVAYATTLPIHTPEVIRAASLADVVVATSPSIVERLTEIFGTRGRPALVAIGPRTAKRAGEQGWESIVQAQGTTPQAIVAAISEVSRADPRPE